MLTWVQERALRSGAQPELLGPRSKPLREDSSAVAEEVPKQDQLAGFSSRGPRVHDAALKPEIVAPGVDITAARSKFSNLGKKGDRYKPRTERWQ